MNDTTAMLILCALALLWLFWEFWGAPDEHELWVDEEAHALQAFRNRLNAEQVESRQRRMAAEHLPTDRAS